MIDWTPLHDALRSWASQADTLASYWAHEERPITDRPLVTLQILSSVEPEPTVVNLVDEDPDDDALAMKPVITVIRDLTVQCRVSCRSQSPDEFALHFAEALRISLSDPEVVSTLTAAGIEIMGHERIFNLAEVSDHRAESRAVLDVMFRAEFADTAQRRRVGFFNRLQLTTAVDRADGSSLPDSLLLDDEEIGPP